MQPPCPRRARRSEVTATDNFGSERAFLPAARDLAFAWRSACTRESVASAPHDQSRRCGELLAAVPAVALIHGAVGCANERKSGQSKARQIKSQCPGMIM